MLSNARKYVKPKPISCQNKKLTQQHNWKKRVLEPMCSKCICSSVSHSVHGWVRAKRGIWRKRVFMRTKVIFLLACIEGILWLFTNFYLQRKFLIFWETIVTVRQYILTHRLRRQNSHRCRSIQYKKEICNNRKFGSYEKHILASKLFL